MVLKSLLKYRLVGPVDSCSVSSIRKSWAFNVCFENWGVNCYKDYLNLPV